MSRTAAALALACLLGGTVTSVSGGEPGAPAVADTADAGLRPLHDAVRGVKTVVTDGLHVISSPLRMSGRDALRVGGYLAATGLLMVYDEEITAALRRNSDEFPLRPILEVGRALDPIGYGNMNVYWLGGLGVSYLARWDTGVSLFGQIIESFAIYGVLRIGVIELVGRRRPYQADDPYEFGREDATSFPSGHAINAFQLATVVSHHVDRPWFTGAAYFGAFCVGMQRIESRSHWASDVFLSAVAGIAISRAVIGLHEDRARARLVPRASRDGLGAALAWRF